MAGANRKHHAKWVLSDKTFKDFRRIDLVIWIGGMEGQLNCTPAINDEYAQNLVERSMCKQLKRTPSIIYHICKQIR